MNSEQFEQLLGLCGRVMLMATLIRKQGQMPTPYECKLVFTSLEEQMGRVRGNRQGLPTWEDGGRLLEWAAKAAAQILTKETT